MYQINSSFTHVIYLLILYKLFLIYHRNKERNNFLNTIFFLFCRQGVNKNSTINDSLRSNKITILICYEDLAE